jgi:hypothetical protein
MSKKLMKSAAVLACCLSAFAVPAMAQNIKGPAQIVSVTSTIPNGNASFPLTQINDNITTNGPHNGFQGVDQPNPAHIGTITFTLDKSYDLDQAWLWNDINVRAEGVDRYILRFFDASNNLISTSGPLSTVAGQVAPHITPLNVSGVKKVEMVIQSVLIRPNTFARRVEIREVAFNGVVTEVPVPMVGNHWQCYRVLEGPTLKPESLVVRDQFGKAEIVLARPLMLCNPSVKVHAGKQYDIERPQSHLVCYQPVKQSDQQTRRRVRINNQMAPATLLLAERQMFCVPSSKKRLDGADLPVGGQID